MLLIDNNLSPKLCKRLEMHFPGCVHVFELNLHNVDDDEVWRYAQTNNLHILSKDFDFVNLVHYRGYPPKVIRLNCGNKTTDYITALILKNADVVKVFLSSAEYGVLVLQ